MSNFEQQNTNESTDENIELTTEDISPEEFEALFGEAAVAQRQAEANQAAFDGATTHVEATRFNADEELL